MAEADTDEKKDEEKKLPMTYPLVESSDMVEDMRNEVIEFIVTACEKNPTNNELAARLIKDTLDKKFGPPWNVIVGEGYGFNISYQTQTLLYMFFGGNVGVCIWKG